MTGHMQKVCRKRIAKGAPCVDEHGQPYKNAGVASIQEEEEEHSSYYAKN